MFASLSVLFGVSACVSVRGPRIGMSTKARETPRCFLLRIPRHTFSYRISLSSSISPFSPISRSLLLYSSLFLFLSFSLSTSLSPFFSPSLYLSFSCSLPLFLFAGRIVYVLNNNYYGSTSDLQRLYLNYTAPTISTPSPSSGDTSGNTLISIVGSK